jgi:hypothetical protein
MNHNRNKIDDCTNDGCPELTPKQLLEEKITPDDCRAVERAMGRFNTTTAFLNAVKQVLVDLESQPEADVLARFLPEMAKVECESMNAPFPDSHDDNPPRRYSCVENGELINAGEVSETERILRIMHSDPNLN